MLKTKSSNINFLSFVTNKTMVNLDDSSFFIILNNATNNFRDSILSGYFHVKFNNLLNAKYVKFKNKYISMFFQPHNVFSNKKWLIAKSKSHYDVYLMERDTMILANQFKHNEFSNSITADFNNSSGWLSLSINPKTVPGFYDYDIFGSNLMRLDSSLEYSFYIFNNATGKIELIKKNYNTPLTFKLPYTYLPSEDLYVFTLPVDIEFSPNDSILYVLSGFGQRNSDICCNDMPSEILQIKWNDNFKTNKLIINDNKLAVFKNIELAADGKIYIAKSIHYDTRIKYKYESALSVISKPNVWGSGCHYIEEALPNIKANSYPVDVYSLPEFFGRFYSLNFKKNISCNHLAKLEVIDTSKWLYFDWFINNDSIRNNGVLFYQFSNKSAIINIKIKGTHSSGYSQWFSDTIIIRKLPSAYFTTQATIGCQYIAFGFKDSSTVFQIKKDSAVRHAWLFGDGNSKNWQTIGFNIRQNQSHTYSQSGTYTVNHIVSDGYCSDTFSRVNEVNILPAPKPGIDADPMSGCVPFSVRLKAKYPDTVDSTQWRSSDGHRQTTAQQSQTNMLFNKAGVFKVMQFQFGPTGCITSDTIEINAIMGINTQSSPFLVAATVLNNENALLYWQKMPFAKRYQVFKNKMPIAITQDSFFIDQTNTNTQSYIYQIRATDVCLQNTQLSNEGKTILLSAKKASVELAVLQWTPYLNWANGVKNYTILEVKNQNDLFIHQTKDSGYRDANFLENGATQKCYKILATQNGNSSVSSESNTVCLNYESIVWLPTAITINSDGINEVFKISTFGIKSYTIGIFNRWGEKVFESSNPDEEWRPKAQEQGVYMYVFKAKTNNGDYITKGTITVLR